MPAAHRWARPRRTANASIPPIGREGMRFYVVEPKFILRVLRSSSSAPTVLMRSAQVFCQSFFNASVIVLPFFDIYIVPSYSIVKSKETFVPHQRVCCTYPLYTHGSGSSQWRWRTVAAPAARRHPIYYWVGCA